jgi:hypothetical protein
MFLWFSDFGCEHTRGAPLVTFKRLGAKLMSTWSSRFVTLHQSVAEKTSLPAARSSKGPVQSWKEFVQKSDWSKTFA